MIDLRLLAAAAALTFAPMAALAQAPAAPATTQAAAFASDRIQITAEGQGRDVILIPGLSSHPEIWQGVVDRLGPGVRVHRVQVAGFAGLAPGANADGPVSAPVAEEIARYIRERGLQRPAVIGHSMGGSIGIMLAARHPGAVGRLMVVDMIPFMGPMFGGPTATSESVRPMADSIRTQMLAASPEAFRAQGAQQVTSMIRTESLRAGPLRHSATSDHRTSTNAFHELIVTDLRPELARITAPTTVVYAPFNAPGMTAEMTDGIYRASYRVLPTARLARIDDSAHFIMLDQPDRFQAEVTRFLAE